MRAALYFDAALQAAAQGAFVLQSSSAEQTTDLDPSRFAFVVLSDTVSLPSIFEHAVAEYVSEGRQRADRAGNVGGAPCA